MVTCVAPPNFCSYNISVLEAVKIKSTERAMFCTQHRSFWDIILKLLYIGYYNNQRLEKVEFICLNLKYLSKVTFGQHPRIKSQILSKLGIKSVTL